MVSSQTLLLSKQVWTIQQKKLGSWKFNLAEARFEIHLISYRSIRIMTVNTTPANPYLMCVTFQEPELQLPPSLQNPAHQLVAVDTKISNKYEFKMAKF